MTSDGIIRFVNVAISIATTGGTIDNIPGFIACAPFVNISFLLCP